MSEDELVPVFIPNLGVLLLNLERQKGSPLTRDEVISIRDEAIVIMVRRSVAEHMADERGYDDLDPENCWEEFLALKEVLANTDE